MRANLAPLQGWGRASSAPGAAYRPERMAELRGVFGEIAGSLIARGAGRSYGDGALNSGGSTVISTRLDRVLSFDDATGVLEAEPGVTFARLLEFLPRGWLVPVTPGTGFATLGGAVANDVHGKNHEHQGSFGQHLDAIDLVLANGQERTVRPGSALFAATIGGLGLTGFITRVVVRMMRVPGPGVAIGAQRVRDLSAFMAALRAAEGATYSVGWIDGTARGGALGRGILEVAEPSNAPVADPPRRGFAMPADAPGFALHPLAVRGFNEAYFRRVPAAGTRLVRPYRQFLYPLDAIGQWNRLYGARGFYQFQCVLPEPAEPGLARLLTAIAQARQASFLAVLKRMGEGRAGMMSFPIAGYTLALDFPRRAGVEDFYASLVRIVRECGGRVYLAKDALMTAEDCAAMYPQLPEFKRVLREIDPRARLQSDMSRRLRLHDA